jgi:hypothetical protein
MTGDEILQRMESARQVMDNPMYREAWTLIRSAYVEKMGKVKPTDTEALQQIALSMQNLDRLEKIINGFFNQGKVEIEKRKRLNLLNK